MLAIVTRVLCLVACLTACGCAHHKSNPYAYAPPLAPPVYPQPQTAGQPVVMPARVDGPPGSALPATAPCPPGTVGPPAAALPGGGAVTTVAGDVPAMADGSCPPCVGQHAVPVAYEAAVQTTPCP